MSDRREGGFWRVHADPLSAARAMTDVLPPDRSLVGVGGAWLWTLAGHLRAPSLLLVDRRRSVYFRHLLNLGLFSIAGTRGDFFARLVSRTPAAKLVDKPLQCRAFAHEPALLKDTAHQVTRAVGEYFGRPLLEAEKAALFEPLWRYASGGVDTAFWGPRLAEHLAVILPTGAPAHFLRHDAAYAWLEKVVREGLVEAWLGDLEHSGGLVSARLRAKSARLGLLYVAASEDILPSPEAARDWASVPQGDDSAAVATMRGAGGIRLSFPLPIGALFDRAHADRLAEVANHRSGGGAQTHTTVERWLAMLARGQPHERSLVALALSNVARARPELVDHGHLAPLPRDLFTGPGWLELAAFLSRGARGGVAALALERALALDPKIDAESLASWVEVLPLLDCDRAARVAGAALASSDRSLWLAAVPFAGAAHEGALVALLEAAPETARAAFVRLTELGRDASFMPLRRALLAGVVASLDALAAAGFLEELDTVAAILGHYPVRASELWPSALAQAVIRHKTALLAGELPPDTRRTIELLDAPEAANDDALWPEWCQRVLAASPDVAVAEANALARALGLLED